jgi:putative transposase
MKYEFIHRYRSAFRVEKMCRVLQVSRSGYYSWIDRPESKRSEENRRLLTAIKYIHKESKSIYGSPRITQALPARAMKASQNRVARMMAKNGIKSKVKRKFRVTTQSDHTLPISPNLLHQDFSASAPNLKLVSDITYIHTREGWLYLTTVIDLFHRKIVGWSMSNRMTAEQTTIAALKQYVKHCSPAVGVIFHSDRGVQYACCDFRELLEKNGFIQSMSGKGNCYDNAVAESFFKTLKTELIYHERYRTRAEARASIFEYIETFYNRVRKHSYLEYLSPEQFERKSKNDAA